MKQPGEYTYQEIMSQAVIWAEVLQAFEVLKPALQTRWQDLQPRQVLFIGCGSTYFLSQIAASLFQIHTGIPARACPSSELLLFDKEILIDPASTLLVTISRSGTTTETVQAVSHFRRLGGTAVWAISCYADSSLVHLSDFALLAEVAQEQSMAQTRSFSSMLLLVQAMTATLAGDETAVLSRLPGILTNLLDRSQEMVKRLGQRIEFESLFYLGSGPQNGLANEAMLKMKEMSLSHSSGFHFLEFRHGPMSMVSEDALIVGLVSDQARRHEVQVLQEMAALGGVVLEVNADPASTSACQVHFGESLPAWAQPVLYLPPLQLLAYHRAMAKGLDPDRPRNLEAVIYLDETAFAPG